jgi:hypothetical protein
MNSTTPTFFNVEIPKPLPRLCQISQFLKMNPEYSVMTLLGVTLAMALPLLFYIWKALKHHLYFKGSEKG